jgi:hypothetical protein
MVPATSIFALSLVLAAPPIGATDESVIDSPEPSPADALAPADPPVPSPVPVPVPSPDSAASEATTPDPSAPVSVPAGTAPAPVASPEPGVAPTQQPEQPDLPPADLVVQRHFALPPPPPPPSGAGRLVAGGFGIGLGLAAVAVLVVEANREAGNPRFVAATFVPLSLTGIGLGSYLLVRGSKARRNLLEWEAYTAERAQPTGDGLIIAGVFGTVIGGVTLITAGVKSRELDAFRKPVAPTLFAVGATSLAFGAGTLTGGLLRRQRYRRWRQGTFLTTGGITPVLAPMLAGRREGEVAAGTGLAWVGASVGVRGMF